MLLFSRFFTEELNYTEQIKYSKNRGGEMLGLFRRISLGIKGGQGITHIKEEVVLAHFTDDVTSFELAGAPDQ
ncbi:MAG: hypothetical protein U5K69_14345 [Balneolaceae bacterium]|nr:hypothetical protein [Balneolaceae bacterium]